MAAMFDKWMVGSVSILLAASAALGPQEPADVERRSSTSADGLYRIECELRSAGDEALLHGLWRRYSATAQSGVQGKALAEGRWVDGLLDGDWTWRYPDGTTLMQGSYSAGLRSGDWEFFRADGSSAARGAYANGLRDKQWHEFTAEGARNTEHGGHYNIERASWAERTTRLRAATLGGERQGEFFAYWRDGQAMVAGRYLAGQPDGWWSLWLVDGTLDPQILTGWYERGELVADAPRPHAREAWEFPYEERVQSAAEPTRRAGPLPVPGRYSRGINSAQRSELQEQLVRYLGGAEDQLPALVELGRQMTSDVLKQLIELDLAKDAGRGQLLTALLFEIAGGRGFHWRSGSDAEAQAANRLAQARWLSWWELVRDDDAWWQRLGEGELGDDEQLLSWDLLTGQRAPEAQAVAVQRPAGSPIAPLRVPLGNRRDAVDVRDAHGLALGWLFAHQHADGHWSSAGFSERCAGARSGPCGGPGHATHDVGLSALALLALMADGRTIGLVGVHEAVDRGLSWLVSQADDSGLIGKREGKEFLYDHALATLALAKGKGYTGRADLEEPLRGALAFAQGARNPQGAWRYEVPPDGDNDTSVTGWMVAALFAADEAGATIDAQALQGALGWIDEVTDPATGRVGYNARGSVSARVTGLNAHYPPQGMEAMTAVGLLCRILIGQEPRGEPVLIQHAELLLRSLPHWHAEGLTNDFYYWYHATRALHALRPYDAAYWNAWSAALRGVLLPAQRQDDHGRGSWDPIGPWGFAGGRVYSTALGALMLEHLLPPPPAAARKR